MSDFGPFCPFGPKPVNYLAPHWMQASEENRTPPSGGAQTLSGGCILSPLCLCDTNTPSGERLRSPPEGGVRFSSQLASNGVPGNSPVWAQIAKMAQNHSKMETPCFWSFFQEVREEPHFKFGEINRLGSGGDQTC